MKTRTVKPFALLLALILASACFFAACGREEAAPEPETDTALIDAGFEAVRRGGNLYYILPGEDGSCYVHTNCGITKFQARAAAEALGSGDTCVEKFIYSDGERTYLFASTAEEEGSAADARVILILEKDGEDWKAAETVPYAMAQSLFEQLVKETADQRLFTDAELRSCAEEAKDIAAKFPEAGGMYGFSVWTTPSSASYSENPPEGKLILSDDGVDIFYNAEESDKILAALLYSRCGTENADCAPDVCRTVLLAYSQGFCVFYIAASGNDPTWNHMAVSNPLKPFLITRDPNTGKITCEFLSDITYIPLG